MLLRDGCHERAVGRADWDGIEIPHPRSFQQPGVSRVHLQGIGGGVAGNRRRTRQRRHAPCTDGIEVDARCRAHIKKGIVGRHGNGIGP